MNEKNDHLYKSVKKTAVLEDGWRFQIDIRNIGEKEAWFSEDFNRSGWGEVTVPQAWDCYETALWGYEGIGWYSVTINPEDFTAGTRTEVLFNRIMYYSKVWINGEYIGENIGGYLPFSFDITDYLMPGQKNHLVIRADNKPRIEWLPAGKDIEWVQYGGILEPVELVSTSHTYIDDFTIRTDLENDNARINCIINTINQTDTESETELNVEIFLGTGITKRSMKLQCKPGESTKVNMELKIDRPDLWSPDTPVLYTAVVSLKKDGAIVDNLTERFGIRSVRTGKESILLNGKPITIKGVNRYDEYGKFGPNVPEEILRKELALMKSVGINTIRVHYPQSSKLLSLYDEFGFMMIEELPLNWWGGNAVNSWDEANQSLDILEYAKPALKKMITRDKNHPCVIIWSMANECLTDNEIGITVMRELIRLAKSLDGTRLVTFVACDDPRKHLAYDEADIVCINKYNGIFIGNICSHIDQIDSLGYNPTVDELTLYSKYYGDKPILITEFGTQGIKNIHGDVRYTEEFQAVYIEKIWDAIQSVPGISGGVLWSWADYYHRKYLINYAAFGPYGVVTVDRKPKKSLEALARMYGGSVSKQ
ncbi:glycoside hydrolase family 2 protein [candidate division KSB1 bacterium]